MDPRTFDGLIQKLSATLSRRTAVGGSVGAAVLTAAGLIETPAARRKKSQVQAEACISTGKKCPAKSPRRRRRRNRKTLGCNRCCQDTVVTVTNNKGEQVTRCGCRPDGANCGGRGRANCCSGVCDAAGKCAASAPVTQPLSEEATGTLTSVSSPTCAQPPPGSCTDEAAGTVQGTPIDGTFTGAFTRTNFTPVDASNYTADLTGTITLIETTTGDTVTVDIVGVVTGEGTPQPSGPFTSTGTYTVTGGTGRFNGASGTGTATSSGTDSGATGTLDSLTLTGDITLL